MPKFDLDALTDSVFHAALNTTHTIEPGQIFLEHSLTQGGSNASAQLHNRIKNALRTHNSDSAEPVAWRVSHGGGVTIWNVESNAKSNAKLTGGVIEPLYLASPPAKEVEITDVRIEQIARSYHDRTGDNETVDWDKCKSRYRTQVRKMVRNVLGCAALTNRTPDDEAGNG